jgi:RNA polymerase sigma-70 factor (ECF subfamily)
MLEEFSADTLLWKVSTHDDKRAFRALFEAYYAPLCVYAKRFIDDRATREDLVQDAFFSIWEKRKSIIAHTCAKNYLIACVRNNCLGHLRRSGYLQKYKDKAARNPPEYAEHGEQLFTLQELQELLEKTLKKLPEEYRLAFVMNRFEGKSTTEIAEYMHVSTRTVERYYNRAIEILKDELKDYLPPKSLLLIFLLCGIEI